MDGTLPHACVNACNCVNCAAMNRTQCRLKLCGCFELFSSRVLLGFLFVAHFPIFAARTSPALAASEHCSELSQKRDLLHTEIERLRAETAMVEAQLGTFCPNQTNQTVDVPQLLVQPSPSTGVRSVDVVGTQHIVPPPRVPTNRVGTATNAEQPPPERRAKAVYLKYAVRCWEPSSAFADPSCNCLEEAPHPNLGSRPTIKVVVGNWYAHALCLPQVVRDRDDSGPKRGPICVACAG